MTTTRVHGVMSDADALLWTIGRDPALRSPIVAVIVLDTAPDAAELERRIELLTRLVPRFRSRVVPRPGGLGNPRWEEDAGFDVSHHLLRVAAPAPGSLRTVLDLAQSVGSGSFDPELPPWQAVVVEGMEAGRAAVVLKVHHSVVDGVAGISILLRLVDRERHPGPGHGAADRPDLPPAVRRRRAGVLDRLAASGGRLVGGSARGLAHAVTGVLVDPLGALGSARSTASTVVRLLAPAPNPLSPLLVGRGLGRRYEVLDYPLERVHLAAERAGGTLNDAFVAALLGGLQRYHARHGETVDRLRTLVPISIRGHDGGLEGNQFVPARQVMPLGVADPVERTRTVDATLGSWKHDPALALTNVLAGVLNLLPAPVTTAVFGSMLKGGDFVATDVPGPPYVTYLAGARVEHLYAFAPTSGAALNVALVTPAERACIGVNIDAAAVDDPEVLMDCLRLGFDEVLGPTGPGRDPRPGPAS